MRTYRQTQRSQAFRMEYCAWQVVHVGILDPPGREVLMARLWDTQEACERDRAVTVCWYRFPYAKDARHQIRWKRAQAVIVP